MIEFNNTGCHRMWKARETLYEELNYFLIDSHNPNVLNNQKVLELMKEHGYTWNGTNWILDSQEK